MTDTAETGAAYHIKALPAGTDLREWRLESVLGTGGFGIVYRGTGVYFGETVAIKEYFPSAISDRREGATVAPNDADSEELYRHGLQKFVEEAKILWNLSQPERHPNIVCVRNLFEIHGTAYIVMDFESGISLSQLLRDGRKFDEASLMAIIRPVALGLERAHLAGVFHRDIKPANILISEDKRPVLIDFGSARFDSGQVTSTKVTFYTPPYAALEQYVRTFPQGPWTDIYALAVTMYQCVTGEKPAEVLERAHGGTDKPLAGQALAGYSPRFLRAIDAGMAIKPEDRPQSIAAWLAMFEGAAPSVDDMTRVATNPSPKLQAKPPAKPSPQPAAKPAPGVVAQEKPKQAAAPRQEQPKTKKSGAALLIGALAVVVLGGAGAAALLLLPKNGPTIQPQTASAEPAAAPVVPATTYAADLAGLADGARTLSRPQAEIDALGGTSTSLTELENRETAARQQGLGEQADRLAAEAADAARGAAASQLASLAVDEQKAAKSLEDDIKTIQAPAHATSEATTKLIAQWTSLQGDIQTDTDAASHATTTASAQTIAAARHAQATLTSLAAFKTSVRDGLLIARRKDFASASLDARASASDIKRLAAAAKKPGAFASKDKKEAFSLLQTSAASAADKVKEIDAISASTKDTDRKAVDKAASDVAAIRDELQQLRAQCTAAAAKLGAQ